MSDPHKILLVSSLVVMFIAIEFWRPIGERLWDWNDRRKKKREH